MHMFSRSVSCLLIASAPAQALLSDINPTLGNNGSFGPYEAAVAAQSVLYFPGNRWDSGTELWRSDGTVAGTRLVRDFVPGNTGLLQGLTTNGTLVFGTNANQIVRSDGTEAGTYAIGSYVILEAPPVPAGSRVIWVTRNGIQKDLWASDGTSTTPVLLLTAQVLDDPVSAGARAFFAAGDATIGRELWYTDGTPAGTVMLDVAPGPGSVEPGNLAPDGAGGVWFSAQTQAFGSEPWHSDGTLAGTQQVYDVWPGSFGSDPREFCAVGTRAYFSARSSVATGVELWVSDVILGNTWQVLDIAPGQADSLPRNIHAIPAIGKVVFSATEPVAGREVWVSDGSLAGTQRLGDFDPGTANGNDGHNVRAAWLGGALWFSSRAPGLGYELYRSDGTPAGTVLARDLWPGPESSGPRPLGEVNGSILFSASAPSIGVELWKATPPATAPTLLAEFHPERPESSFATYVTPLRAAAASLDGRQHFAAWHPSSGIEPYVHDGTPAGTTLVGQVTPGSGGRSRLLTATSTHVYYETTSDGLGANARLVAVGRSGGPVVLRNGVTEHFAVLRDRLIFSQVGAGESEPMITDGTVAGTVRIADVRPGAASSNPTAFATVGDRVWFFADNGVAGHELWTTDGTAAGTSLLVDIVPGAAGVSVPWMLAGSSHAFFRSGGAVWATDGTAAGTVQGPAVPFGFERVVLDDAIVLVAGNQLWRADGTAAGTFVLAQSDLVTGEPIRNLCVARGLAFCVMQRQAVGPQLWRTDGTVAGTSSVLTLHPSPFVPAPQLATAGLGHLACALTDPVVGNELFISDGTVAGTTLVVDAQPGSAPSNPVFPLGDTTAGGRFTWWADTVATGLEPWSVPLASFGGSDFDHYGVGCPGTNGVPHVQGDGLPILGSPRLAWQLRNARPSSIALLVVGFTRVPGPSPCTLLNSADVSVALFVDAFGRAEYSLPVPTTASLASATLSAQFVVLDPLGILGLAAATAAVEALIGR